MISLPKPSIDVFADVDKINEFYAEINARLDLEADGEIADELIEWLSECGRKGGA